MVQEKTLVTVEEFEQYIALPENRDFDFELIDGEIVAMMPTEEHGEIAAFLTVEVGLYLRANPIGRIGVEVRHRMPGDRHNDFLPDVSVTLDLTSPRVKKGAVPRMPDLAIEIKSPDDTMGGLGKKAAYYLEHGSRLVWLVYPDNRTVEVLARGMAGSRVLAEQDMLDGGEVLPGFSLKVAAIFK